MGTSLITPAPGGWARLAAAVAAELPVGELDGIWAFPPLRHDRREFGTAILSRVDGARRRIYTARYVATLKGPERGAFSSAVEEVGSGPVEALALLVADAARRLDDGEPPAPVALGDWYPETEARAAAEP